MLTWRVQKKEKSLTILFFPNGTIQCVGNTCDDDVRYMHMELCDVLQLQLPDWEMKSMTVLCMLNKTCNFRHLSSNKHVTYEVEIFPAAQMTFWHNVHVHVFHNGKMIITGIKDISHVSNIVHDVLDYLNKQNV